MSAKEPRAILVEPGQQVDLDGINPRGTPELKKTEGKALMPALRQRINDLQDLLFADRRHAVLIILQGIDTAGKDGTVKSVFQDVGPLGCRGESFGIPSEEDREHDMLWRYHRRTPRRGELVIFNRSHYESVLVERVKGIVPKEVWEPRYDQINGFESMLAAEGTVILKFFLHISKAEQRVRLQARLDNPAKRWKFERGDLDDRALWDQYQAAFQEMLRRCSADVAPWFVVPADRKWYRDLAVAARVIERLEALDLRFPPSQPGLEDLMVQ